MSARENKGRNINRSRRSNREVETLLSILRIRFPPRYQQPQIFAQRFIAAGVLTLSQSELRECAARLADAGEPNPLEHPSLTKRDVLKRAKEQCVDLDDWAERTSFLIDEAIGDKTNEPA